MPIFFVVVGLPYSGKSVYAEGLREKFGTEIHSSNVIRTETLGNVQDQINNQIVFGTLYKRVVSDLSAGKGIIYDATDTNYKRHTNLLNRLSRVKCQRVYIVMATPFHECEERSKHCGRVVSHEALARIYKSFRIPYWYKGQDVIELIYPDNLEPHSVSDLFDRGGELNSFEQDNPHHILTVGHHRIAIYGLVFSGSIELQEAALLYDIDKPFIKSFVSSKDETTEIAYYYERQHVSTYDSLFYSNPNLGRLYITNIIQWYMRPFELERDSHSGKAQKRFKKLVDSKLYSDVMKLHAADIEAKGT